MDTRDTLCVPIRITRATSG